MEANAGVAAAAFSVHRGGHLVLKVQKIGTLHCTGTDANFWKR